MEINGLVPSPAGSNFANTKRVDVNTEIVTAKAQNATKDSVVAQIQVKDVQRSEEERLDTVIQASRSFQASYAVSDTKFTIFKDRSGQFVTRFTNLADGSVTYIPEPDIVRFMESHSDRRNALVEVEA